MASLVRKSLRIKNKVNRTIPKCVLSFSNMGLREREDAEGKLQDVLSSIHGSVEISSKVNVMRLNARKVST